MDQSLYWHVSGKGKSIVLVHGWGMNGAVWQQTVKLLETDFKVHVVDLPGYGHSAHCDAESLEEIAVLLIAAAPKDAIWVGWSLGGLIATYIALKYPSYVNKLVTVASSPKFSAAEDPVVWRGIAPNVLTTFTEQLADDFQGTIDRFMALQTMGSPTARQDVVKLKEAVLSRPKPNRDSLITGLNILRDVDLRSELFQVSMPMLRLYGRLDALVPVNISKQIDKTAPHTKNYIFRHSSHAPFITESAEFYQQLLGFSKS